jgi:8-oxo-dGTP pyrophosphatase MutT (NUDIX family)
LTGSGVDRCRVVPAAYVFFRRGEDVLLQLRQGTGYMDGHWAAAAAGHVEAEESVLDAACRDAREELGVTIRPAGLLPLTAMHRTQGNHEPIDERVDFFFECRTWEGEPRLLESEKAADLGWFSLEALPHPVVPHELHVLDLWNDGALPPVVTFGF